MLWLVAASLALAPPCDVRVSFEGPFSAQAEWLVNRINAPANQDKARPPPLKIDPAVLTALNAAAPAAVTRAGQTVCPKNGDKRALRVMAGGNDEVGGEYSGTLVRVELWTVGHVPELVGRASKNVTALGSTAGAVKALDAVLATTVAEADKALAVAIRDDASAHPHTLTLTLDFWSLDRAGADAAVALVPCFVEVGGALSSAPAWAPEKNTKVFEVRYRTREVDGAPFVANFANQIRSNTGAHGKFRCSFFRTALVDRAVDVVADPAKGTIRVQFPKPKR